MTENNSQRLDASNAQIIEQYRAKSINEDTARALLYDAVVHCNVCAGIIVSTSVPGVDKAWLRNRREDFQSDVHRLIHDKLVGETGAKAFFNFAKFPNSMTGWVRQFLRVAYPRMANDLYQKERRQLPTEDEVLASLVMRREPSLATPNTSPTQSANASESKKLATNTCAFQEACANSRRPKFVLKP